MLHLNLPAAVQAQLDGCIRRPSCIILTIRRKPPFASMDRCLCKQSRSWNLLSHSSAANLGRARETILCYSLKAIKWHNHETKKQLKAVPASSTLSCWGFAGEGGGPARRGHIFPLQWSSGSGAALHHQKCQRSRSASLGLQSIRGHARPCKILMQLWG